MYSRIECSVGGANVATVWHFAIWQLSRNTPFYILGAILDFHKVTCLYCKQITVVTVKHSKTIDWLALHLKVGSVID